MSRIGDPDRYEWVAFDADGRAYGFHSHHVEAMGRMKAKTYNLAQVAKEFPEAHRIELMVGPELKAIFDQWAAPRTPT